MLPNLKARFLAASAVALLAVPATARAQGTTDFATCPATLPACTDTITDCCHRAFSPVSTDRAIVIPLDRCHQRLSTSGKDGPPTSTAPAWCANPSPGADQGMYQAYGLVYRLMQAGIPVYWAINPTKDPPALTAKEQTYIAGDVDLWVLAPGLSKPPEASESLAACGYGCTAPVRRLSPSSLAPIGSSYDATAFPVRGSAFVIAPEDRERFNDFWLRRGDFTGLSDFYYNFSAVDLYELTPGATIVYQDFTSTGPAYNVVAGAPVAVTLDYEPPRLARQSPAGVSEIWLDMAKLDQPAKYPACLTGAFQPAGAVYCDITESDIQQGYLVEGEFIWAWIDNWSDNSPCSSQADVTQHDKIAEFLTAEPGIRPGGHVMLMEKAVGVVEGCKDHELAGRSGIGLATDNKTPKEPFIFRYPANLFMQWGDLPVEFASGAVGGWYYFGGGALGYDPSHLGTGGTLVRLVTEDRLDGGNELCVGHQSTPACDVFANSYRADLFDVAAYLRYQDDPRNGVVFYMGGNQVNNAPSHLRMILNAFIALPVGTVSQVDTDPVEVSRASPIIATVDGLEAQYQGTYEVLEPPPPVPVYRGEVDNGTFEFPYVLGHMRAIDTADIGFQSQSYTDIDPIFDAANGIPDARPEGCGTAFSASCRTVFTNVETGLRPERVFVSTASTEKLAPLLAPKMTTGEVNTLISRVLAGHQESGVWEPRLGGVDRSTVAVIEASPTVGVVRPTMVYFGALDGMLHAVCAEVLGPCKQKGQELWAFIPRTQLPFLRFNTQRVDGSPKVADVFGDFDGDGLREWRTVLTFQTGSGEPGYVSRAPAVYALDITSPADPQILWEVATPASRSASELGIGLTLAMGRVRIGSDIKNLTFAQTNNGGTGEPGMRVAAINTVTGEVIWTFSHDYAVPPRGLSTIPPVPSTGIPGGVAIVDRVGFGTITDVVVPSLYGDLWVLDAATGESRYGDVPLFRFSTNYHPIGAPPTIYRDRATGTLHALVVSGGYADPIGSSWAPDSVDQYAVGISLETPESRAPMSETGPDYGVRPIVYNLGAGNRAYAQAIIAGDEVYIVTDESDVNASNYGTFGATGKLTRLSLSGGGALATGVELTGGAGSVDVRNGVVYAGSGSSVQKADYSSTFDGNGSTIVAKSTETAGRKLWLLVR